MARGGASRGWERGAGRRRQGPVLALAALVALAAAAPAAAGDLSGRADLTYAWDDLGATSSDYLRQVYWLDYRRQVSQPITYRLSLRYQDDRGTTEAAGRRTPLRLQALAPTASLDYRLESFGLTASWRRTDERFLDAADDRYHARVIERLGGAVWLAPFPDGDVTVAADRLAFRSAEVDTSDDRLGVTFRYGTGAFRLVDENRLQRFEDGRTGLSRTSMGPRLTVGYGRTFGEAGSLSAQYLLDWFRNEQEVRTGAAASVAVEVQPAAGLYAQDDLPIDTAPLPPLPALVDRVFDAPAGVSLGPGGVSFQNLGLDLGRFEAVDELRVHVRGAGGAPVPFGGSITWSAYTSQDGLRWAPVDGVTALFTEGMSAWQVTFPPVSARFVKVVNFGVNTVETQVTELQAFVHEAFQPGAPRRSSSLRQGLGLSLASRPWRLVQLAVTARANADAVTPPGAARRWTSDLSALASASAGPFGPFLLGAAQGVTTARQPFGFSQTSVTSAASVRWQPLERLTAVAEGRRAEDRIRAILDVRTVTTGASLSSGLGLLEALRASVQAGFNRQEIEGGGVTWYLTASGQLAAALRRDLDLVLDANAQRTLARRGDTSAQLEVPLIRILVYERYTAEARWHPGPQLALVARIGWSAAEAQGGLLQSYRASWAPFPGGAVQLAFDYAEEVDPLTGRSLRRLAASPRWTINRHASLELDYNMVRGTGSLPVRQQNLFLTFSLRL
ncbi:MAG TPA: hypothetical protein VFP50_02925 [Anaeromyxobacteraceae bacterium]|nr:hypothetical protein [Anaeromyxobacteraceae bacterium]